MNLVLRKNIGYLLLLMFGFVSVLIVNDLTISFNENNLDHHWQYSLNYATVNDWIYGKEIIFTYGPLGFVAYPINDGLSFPLILLSWAIRSIYVVYFLCIVFEFSEHVAGGMPKSIRLFTKYMLIPLMLINIGLSEYSILIFICLVHAALIAFNNTKNVLVNRFDIISNPQIAAAFTGLTISLLFYIKVSFLPFFLAIPILLGTSYIIKKEFNLLAVFIVMMMFSFLLIKTSFSIDIADYVINAIELIEGYRKAMQLIYWPNYLDSYYFAFLLIAAFGIHVIFNKQLRRKTSFSSMVIILLSVYFLFMYSYTRGWSGGVIYNIPYAVFIFYFTNYFTCDVKWTTRNNYFILFVLCISFYSSRACFYKLQNLVKKNKIVETTSHQRIPRKYLNKTETYDVYPINSGFTYFNDLKYTPRPTIQSYTAYTPKLDSKTADFFLNKNVDHLIFFGDCQNSYWQNAIDARYFMFDEPLTKLAILKNYTLSNKINDSLFIASKRKDPINIKFTLVKTIKLDLEQSLLVDESFDKNELYFFTIDLNYSTYAKMKGLIYRMPYIKAEMMLNSGEQKKFNVVPDLLKSPSILNWYCNNYSDFIGLLDKNKDTSQSVKSIQFKPNSKRGFEKSAVLKIYKASVEEGFIADKKNLTQGINQKANKPLLAP